MEKCCFDFCYKMDGVWSKPDKERETMGNVFIFHSVRKHKSNVVSLGFKYSIKQINNQQKLLGVVVSEGEGFYHHFLELRYIREWNWLAGVVLTLHKVVPH